MAKVRPNSDLNDYMGKTGNVVYRRFRGRTIVQRIPVFTQPPSDAQKQVRATFSGGSEYARRVGADPVLRERYKAHGRRARLTYRHMAIRDYFNPPQVTALVVETYTPATGGLLIVRATDDFEVARVTFGFRDAAGALLFESAGTLINGEWHLTVPPPVPGTPLPARVRVTAYDHPGNSDAREHSFRAVPAAPSQSRDLSPPAAPADFATFA
jgi:hypothetical protein